MPVRQQLTGEPITRLRSLTLAPCIGRPCATTDTGELQGETTKQDDWGCRSRCRPFQRARGTVYFGPLPGARVGVSSRTERAPASERSLPVRARQRPKESSTHVLDT